MFITFEGPDGSGKTTQVQQTVVHLRSKGYDVLLTREPGGTAIGDQIRDVLHNLENTAMHPRAELLLYNASRAQLVEEVIRPQLAKSGLVVCDRFYHSTLAYQGYGAGVPIDRLRALAEIATDGLEPDLTLLLDVPVEVGLARKAPEDVTRFEAEFEVDFHRRVRDGFLALAAAEPERIVVLDATGPLDAVARAAAAAVDARMSAGEPESIVMRTNR